MFCDFEIFDNILAVFQEVKRLSHCLSMADVKFKMKKTMRSLLINKREFEPIVVYRQKTRGKNADIIQCRHLHIESRRGNRVQLSDRELPNTHCVKQPRKEKKFRNSLTSRVKSERKFRVHHNELMKTWTHHDKARYIAKAHPSSE